MKKILSKEVLSGISLSTLDFVKPYTEICEWNNQFKGKKLFLRGGLNQSGILLARYVDNGGNIRYQFKSITTCLNNAARRTHQCLVKRLATNIEFVMLPLAPPYHAKAIKIFEKDYMNLRLDHNFEIVRPWLLGECTGTFPFEKLTFRRPFFDQNNNRKRFSFWPYQGRGGLYFIRKELVLEKEMVNVYTGKSINVLPNRVRDKFHPNPHLFYEEIPGIVHYHIAMIEIKKTMLPSGVSYAATIKKYENILMNLWDTVDNKLGMIRDVDLESNGKYVKILDDNEEGF